MDKLNSAVKAFDRMNGLQERIGLICISETKSP